MTTKQAVEVWLGADWSIEIQCNDGAGADIDLTGGNVEFIIAGDEIILTADTATFVSLTDPEAGAALFFVAAADQAALEIEPGLYSYEVYALPVSGGRGMQAYGAFIVRQTLRNGAA